MGFALKISIQAILFVVFYWHLISDASYTFKMLILNEF